MATICEHLEPLERSWNGAACGSVSRCPAPTDRSGGSGRVDCTFDAAPLRARLGLPDFIRFQEYDGRVAGSDATFYCPRCRRAIMGRHPAYAGPTTPRLT